MLSDIGRRGLTVTARCCALSAVIRSSCAAILQYDPQANRIACRGEEGSLACGQHQKSPWLFTSVLLLICANHGDLKRVSEVRTFDTRDTKFRVITIRKEVMAPSAHQVVGLLKSPRFLLCLANYLHITKRVMGFHRKRQADLMHYPSQVRAVLNSETVPNLCVFGAVFKPQN